MPCHTRMKLLLQGIFWLCMLEFGFMVTSLEPGFLDFDNLPDTNFSCVGKVIGGYYADLETSCQMFHVCTIGQLDEPMDIRFLCLNGTVFDQETRVCERIDEVDCSKSEQFYSLNLELYGNTQPPILEETPETEVPEVLQKSATTTTTTTTVRPTVAKATRPSFIITTAKPSTQGPIQRPQNSASPLGHVMPTAQIPQPPKPPQPQPQLHFGSRPSADIRFNPEEYKIALSSSGPPTIRTNVNVKPSQSANAKPKPSDSQTSGQSKPVSFQTFSDNNKRVIVTTHTTVYKTEKQPLNVATVAPIKSEILKPLPLEVEEDSEEQEESESEEHDYDVESSDSTEDNYSYGYRNSEALKPAYTSQAHTEHPHLKQYRPDLQTGFRPSQVLPPPIPQPLPQPLPPLNLQEYKASTYRSVFHPASNNPLKINYNHQGTVHGPTTYRNHYGYFNQASIPVPVQVQHKNEKHVRPSLPPLTFSSPAPFSLNRHIETKRFIDHRVPQQNQQASQQLLNHHQPPRIVISASASVSDASGRKFNYSLGTIGDTRFFGHAPQSYDDYKEDDVSLDPFYHDVPKIRGKRQVGDPPNVDDPEVGEKEAIDVLKFLFNWYNNHEKNTPVPLEKKGIPVRAETITEINDALSETLNLNQDHDQDQQILEGQDQDVARDYVYEEFDIGQRHSNYAGIPQKNDGRPYLSLQLLKPPFTESQVGQSLPDVASNRGLNLEVSKVLEPKSTTETLEQSYYDYVDDNYEPLSYNHKEEIKKEPGKPQITYYQNKEFSEVFKKDNSQNENIFRGQEPIQEFNETDSNYPLLEYVDDNYEPVVYQHKKAENDILKKTLKDEVTKKDVRPAEVVTTPETLTTLKEPHPEITNTNYYYDIYNTKTVTTELPTQNRITPSEPSTFSEGIPIYPIYNRNQVTDSTLKTTETSPTSVTENYHQVLGILGITTRKPIIQTPSEIVTKKSRARSHNRGKARFSLEGIDVPHDKVFRRITTTRVPPTQTTKKIETVPSTIQTTETSMRLDTTTELYTMSINRRTEDMGFESVIPTEVVTSTMASNVKEGQKEGELKEERVFIQGVDGRHWEKLGETTTPSEVTTEDIRVTTEEELSEGETTVTITTEGSVNLEQDATTVKMSLNEGEKIERGNIEENGEISKGATNLGVTLKEGVEFSEGVTTEVAMTTTMYMKLIEVVEASTGGVIVEQSETRNGEITTPEVPTTLEFSTDGPSFESTTPYPSTITTSLPTTFSSLGSSSPSSTSTTIRPHSNFRNSRRRSKSRFRLPVTTVQTTTTTTLSSTSIPSSTTEESTTFSSPFPSSSSSSRRPTINEEIIGALKHNMPNSDGRNFEFNINAYTANLAYRVKTTPLTLVPNQDFAQHSEESSEDELQITTELPPTNPPLARSAQPTLSNEHLNRSGRLPTTPISQSTAINVRKQVKHRRYTFNCVDKEVDRFYSDPRDCRLFHYCTRGFTRTQYLDMKFVCDQGTFFDDVKLVCTRDKPVRCS